MDEVERSAVTRLRKAGGSLSIIGNSVHFEHGGDRFTADIDLGPNSYVAIGAHSSWGYLIGLAGADIAFFSERGISIATDALTRIDFTGKVDPGGIHRIEGVPIEGDREVVVTEFSLALLAADGICWSADHFDLTARLAAIDADEVWLQGEVEAYGYSLATGDALVFRSGGREDRDD